MTDYHARPRRFKWIAILMIPIIVLFVCWLVMTLWNAILPDVLPVKSITYIQAIGIFILSRILFGSLRFQPGWHQPKYVNHLRERWKNMTPEEKENFRKDLRNRFDSCNPGETQEVK